ncbi:MAG TPA: hypothetical protein VMG12_44450 [Polyangiaceae bacterium]|nr:hypothetical protein [Polyangiaceae bacterium]
MPPKPAGYEILALDPDHVAAAEFNMLFVVWQRRTLQPAVRAVITQLKRLATKHPGGIGLMQVLEETSVVPDPETRELFPEVLGSGNIQHFSITYVGTGFRAAAIRATLTAMFWVARPSFEYSTQTSVLEAGHWHAERQRRLGRKETGRDIEAVMTALRLLHRERYPEVATRGPAPL